MKSDNEFRRGLIDGIPIGLAYVAVSFAFGISGASKGIPVWLPMAKLLLMMK